MENEKKDHVDFPSKDIPPEDVVPSSQKFPIGNISSPILAAAGVVFIFLIGIVIWIFTIVFGPKPTQFQQNETTKQAATPTPLVKQTIDTSNWKTYKDDYFGFTIKYPPNFIATHDREETRYITAKNKDVKIKTITFELANGTSLNLQIEENDNFKSSEEYQKFYIESYNNYAPEQIKKITIDNVSAALATKQMEGYGIEEPSNPPPLPYNSKAFFAVNGKTFDIELNSPAQIGPQEELISKILSTFKFTK